MRPPPTDPAERARILRARLDAGTDRSGECWVFTGSKAIGGYGRTRLSLNGRAVQYLTHRLAYEFYVGPIPPGHDVCHRCDNPPCVRPDHLFAGTRAENNWDKQAKGRATAPKGEASHFCTALTEEKVRAIRAEFDSGARVTALARKYGIDSGHCSRLTRRLTWKHIP